MLDIASVRSLRVPLLCVGGFASLALLSYGFAVYDLLVAVLDQGLPYTLVDRDFANYWVAGQLAHEGRHLDLFTQDVYFAHLQSLFGSDYQIRAWSYPPHFLLMVWPLGFAEYKSGFVAFLSLTLLLFTVAVLVFRREFAPTTDVRVLMIAVFGYVLMMLAATQNGFLTAAFLLLGLAWMKSRPVLAGFAFACLTIKPQLGLLVPVLLIFDRNWRAMVSAVGFTIAFAALSAFVFGIDSWVAYFQETLAYQRSVMTDWYGIFLRMMPTAFGSVRTLGFSAAAAAQAQLPITIAAVVATFWLLRRVRDPLQRIFVVTCATFLVTPYAFNYDMGALCVCAALLASTQSIAERIPVLPIALVAAVAPAVTNLGRAGLPITPLVLAIGLGAVAFAARASASRGHETPVSAPTQS